MKRSEAIMEIASEVILWQSGQRFAYPSEESIYDFAKAKNLAEHIITAAEKAGMLPPPTTFQEMDAGLNDVMLKDSSGTVYLRRKDLFTWEAE